MAKITITIEDQDNGRVKVTANPTFEAMATMASIDSKDTTPAHGYAIRVIREVLKLSKELKQKGSSPILLPGLERRQ
jgi:hypothetical protein